MISVFHTGPVEPGSCLQKLVGNVPTGVILKDVSLEIHGGELMAILGSKGSGKRALLEVISRRAQGPTRGQILLNHVPMSLRLFQDSCGYVTHKTQLLEALTPKQTLEYASKLSLSSKIGSSLRSSRVRQVLADLALTQVANRSVDQLTPSEYRRLVIGVQLIKDPLVVLLDEPAWGLDPLNTYFVISILSNHAKKYNRIMIITMEKPRSDILPFLDRVSYLCLGDVVYTGSTRHMIDYFRTIGFPCPELENPLMYYLCLSTVDRRSRERFIDSNNQIAALVEKFKLEGGPYRKYSGPPPDVEQLEHKVPLSAYGRPGIISTIFALLGRAFTMMSPCSGVGLQQLFFRLFLLPTYFFLLWNFYYELKPFQRSFQSRGGLIFNCLAGTAFLATVVTSKTFAPHRTRYYHEAREGLYRGPLFILTYNLFSLPVSYISVMAAAAIVYFGLFLGDPQLEEIDWMGWVLFGSVLWAVWAFVEQQTIALMIFVKSSYSAGATSVALTSLYLLVASASLRSLIRLSDWLYYLGHVIVFRYASAVLHEQAFLDKLPNLPVNASATCPDNNAEYGCRYRNGTYYLLERYHFPENGLDLGRQDLDLWYNFGLSFAFFGGMLVLNLYFPHVFLSKTGPPFTITGSMPKVVDIIATKLGYCYEFVVPEDRLHGMRLPNGSFNGVIGMVSRGESDMSGVALFMNPSRVEAVDPSISLYTDASVMAYKRPVLGSDITGFIKPYTLTGWLGVFGMMVVVFLALLGFQWGSSSGGIEKWFSSQTKAGPSYLWTSSLWTLCGILAQASPSWPRGEGVRVMAAVWLLTSLVVSQVYRCNLKAMLILPRLFLPFNNLEELVESEIPTFVSPGTVLHANLLSSPEGSTLHDLTRQLVTHRDSWRIPIDLMAGKYTVFASHHAILSMIHSYYGQTKECPAYLADTVLFTSGISLTFPKGSTLRPLVNSVIQRLKEAGILDHILRDEVINAFECLKSQSTKGVLRPLQLGDFYGVFCVYAAGEVYEEPNLSEILRLEDEGKYLVHFTPLSGTTRLEVRLLADRWKGYYPPLLTEKVKINRKMVTVGEEHELAVTLSVDGGHVGYPKLDVELNGETVVGSIVNSIPPSLQLQDGSSFFTAIYLKGKANLSVDSWDHHPVTTPRRQHSPTTMITGARGNKHNTVRDKETVTQDSELWLVTATSSTTINTTSNSNTTTESESWWAFVFVLGEVGGVPVLAMLVLSVFIGVGLGCTIACLCMKRHQRGKYRNIPTQPPRLSGMSSNADFIKERSTYTFNGDGGYNSGLSNTSNSRLAHSNSSIITESTLNHPFIRTKNSASRNNSLEPYSMNHNHNSNNNSNNNSVNNLGKPLVCNSTPSSIERGFNIPITDRVKNNLDRAASGSINNSYTIDRHRRYVHGDGGSASSSIERGRGGSASSSIERRGLVTSSRSPYMNHQGKSLGQDTDDENTNRPYLVPHVVENMYETPYGSIPEANTEPEETPYQRDNNSVPQKFDTFRKYRQ
ncbi:hypothetical protein Pmani_029960 [Petrolisthes manimaculis]|uniref:ABC transporter domain-containing protein n=1 Tax=Petrolisthes manimaculis TaxID=1843537 RepID=A0AAE1NYE3_9EUCA|nr:hypothetical protein Pmani_029960 [Petrolisthes manimaculis]